MSGPLPKFVIEGPPRERGRMYGQAFAERLHAFLGEHLARINLVRPAPLPRKEALEAAAAHARVIEEDLPDQAEELRGIAEGARLEYEEVALLQVRRELIGLGEDCTSIAGRLAEGRPFVAQTVDLPGDLTGLGMVLEVKGERGKPDILMFTHLGLMGFLGLNSAGIAVGINMVLAPGWRPGVPPYLLVRRLLEQDSLEGCLREISRVRRASSRSLVLAQGARRFNVEMTVERHALLEGELLLHTNHYLHPELALLGRVKPTSSTRERLLRVAALVEARPGLEEAALREILADHQGTLGRICAHAETPARSATVAAAMLFPGEGRMLATRGNPCRNPFHPYALS